MASLQAACHDSYSLILERLAISITALHPGLRDVFLYDQKKAPA